MPYNPPSIFPRLAVWGLFAALIAAAALRAEELNRWPFSVQQVDPAGVVTSGEYLGPFFFEQNRPDGTRLQGFRPLQLQIQTGPRTTNHLFYPLFSWQSDADGRSFSFFELINFRQRTESGRLTQQNFDVWPLYFSRDTGDPAESYRAFFPLGGTIKHRFGQDRIRFTLFPLYSRTEKSGLHITHAPWPFLRLIEGAGHEGFEFWPLLGHRGRAGDYDRWFCLWPFVYKSAKNLSEPQPTVSVGALPFYTRDTAPGYIDESYAWPLFGYTRRTEPYHYNEQRFFWPLFVQGRGDQRFVNRWAPFYTHSRIKGYDKTWLAWPLFRHATWEANGLAQQKDQFLFFIYWSLTQRSTTNPAAAPANKTHVWPLLTSWDNGAGRRQLQLLSPFEVFFPTNEPIRHLYSPLLALYRYDQPAPGHARHSVLFNLLSWKKSPGESDFHLGPLIHVRTTPEKSRVAFVLGLFSLQRPPHTRPWRLSLFDFHPKMDNKAPAPMSP